MPNYLAVAFGYKQQDTNVLTQRPKSICGLIWYREFHISEKTMPVPTHGHIIERIASVKNRDVPPTIVPVASNQLIKAKAYVWMHMFASGSHRKI